MKLERDIAKYYRKSIYSGYQIETVKTLIKLQHGRNIYYENTLASAEFILYRISQTGINLV